MALAPIQSVHVTISEPSDMLMCLHSSLVLLHLSQRVNHLIIRLLTATCFGGLLFKSDIESSIRAFMKHANFLGMLSFYLK